MVNHIVMWKLKEADKVANASKIKEQLEALKNEIKEVQKIRVDFNSDKAPQANFDVILESHFNSFEDLDAYQNNPKHQQVVAFIKQVVDQRVAIDYEY